MRVGGERRRCSLAVGRDLLEDFLKTSRGTSAEFTGKKELMARYQAAFEENARLLASEEIDDLDRGIRLFLDYLLLAEDEGAWHVLMEMNVIQRFIELFMTHDTPLVCEACVSVLAELQYWKALPMNDDLASAIVARCIEFFDWGDQELNFSVLVFIQNLCADYPRFSNMFLDQALFVEYYHFFMIDMKRPEKFLDQLGVTSLAVVRNPFNPENVGQVVCLVNQWLKYPYNVSIRYALKIVQLLSVRGFQFPFKEDDFQLFEGYSASRDKNLLVDTLKTLTCLKNDEFVERCLTDCFLDNLAIQIYQGRKDDIVVYIFKFMKYILPFTRPIGSDLIVVVTCVSISKGRYSCMYYGLKFFRDCCYGNDKFTVDLCNIGVCSLAAPSLSSLGQSKIGSVAADLLVLIGAAFQKHGLDITAAFGYDQVIEAVGDIEAETLTRDDAAKLHDIEVYFNML